MNIKNAFKKIDTLCFGVLLVFVLAVGVRCYTFMGKEDMFLDEYLSVMISSYHDEGWAVLIDDNKVHTGKDVRHLLLSDDNSMKGVLKDIFKMHYSTRDRPHTNLYYSFLRLSFLNADTSDLSQVLLRGFCLNLLFFSIGFLFLYKISLRLFGRNVWLAICVLAVAFLNPASVANTLFIRPYQLQEAVFVLFAYVWLGSCHALVVGKRQDTWEKMLFFAFILALTLLTGYFAVIYVGLLGLVLFWLAYKSDKKSILFFIFVLILGYVFTLTAYQAYNYGIMSDRGQEALNSLDVEAMWGNLLYSLKSFLRILQVDYIGVVPLALLFILVGLSFKKWKNSFNDKEKRNLFSVILFLVSLLWAMIVTYLASMKEVRYIAPALPIFSLFVPIAFSLLKGRKQKYVILLFSVFVLGKTLMSDNLYWGKPEGAMLFNEKANLPLVIAGSSSGNSFGMGYLLPYIDNEQEIVFSNNKDRFDRWIWNWDQLYVSISNYGMEDFSLPAGYLVKEERKDNFFTYYFLEKEKH